MNPTHLLNSLGYSDSPGFLSGAALSNVSAHTHVFRRAKETFPLHGVYVLGDDSRQTEAYIKPVVYVAEAKSSAQADAIHRVVWNQDVVPFLIIQMPFSVRVYSGFAYDATPSSSHATPTGLLESDISLNEIETKLAPFHAAHIDDGSVWKTYGQQADQQTRMNRRLLANLQILGQWLHDEGLEQKTAHALIGKFVYLRYLIDRQILSDRKFQEWGLHREAVLGRQSTVEEFKRLVAYVDDWLNGGVFPLDLTKQSAVQNLHLRTVAGVFLGDEPSTGQLHLNFLAYNFSYIPIEMLSIIYEQFLAIEDRNKAHGAFYTPLPLVDLLLTELDGYHPLKIGMKVLDPSCGSGAFLVQCYRRLIEQHLHRSNQKPRRAELRDLLTKHIYGIDRDSDACCVAELSLVLTLLDYIDPPDLHNTSFKLPTLHNENIFEGDFFDPHSVWQQKQSETKYDWIVGNPPWIPASHKSKKELFQGNTSSDHDMPLANNQIAEAFAWKAATHIAPSGIIGLLLPATTLFKKNRQFRKHFFSQMKVWAVANFANLRKSLFGKRATWPTAAIVYSPRPLESVRADESVLVYSPLLINQEVCRPSVGHTPQDLWAITVNASEVRRIPVAELTNGDSLPWKLAMWGSERDAQLLHFLERRFPSLSSFAEKYALEIREGFQLRECGQTGDEVVPLREVAGKMELIMQQLTKRGDAPHLHAFPPEALVKVSANRAFARVRGGLAALKVCHPPHIIVSAARTFAIFSNRFIVVPPRQIGIAGPNSESDRLRALSLFLNSSVARYHQFLASPEGGIKEGRSTIDALKQLPIPLDDLNTKELRSWISLHDRLIAASTAQQAPLLSSAGETVQELEQDLNRRVYDLMGLKSGERTLIEDLVNIRMPLIDGKITRTALSPPSIKQLRQYAALLRKELDTFVGSENEGYFHWISILCTHDAGLIEIRVEDQKQADVAVVSWDEKSKEAFHYRRRYEQLTAENPQWRYFDRNEIKFYQKAIYILKPLQYLLWLPSQALVDADEVIAAALTSDKSR